MARPSTWQPLCSAAATAACQSQSRSGAHRERAPSPAPQTLITPHLVRVVTCQRLYLLQGLGAQGALYPPALRHTIPVSHVIPFSHILLWGHKNPQGCLDPWVTLTVLEGGVLTRARLSQRSRHCCSQPQRVAMAMSQHQDIGSPWQDEGAVACVAAWGQDNEHGCRCPSLRSPGTLEVPRHQNHQPQVFSPISTIPPACTHILLFPPFLVSHTDPVPSCPQVLVPTWAPHTSSLAPQAGPIPATPRCCSH